MPSNERLKKLKKYRKTFKYRGFCGVGNDFVSVKHKRQQEKAWFSRTIEPEPKKLSIDEKKQLYIKDNFPEPIICLSKNDLKYKKTAEQRVAFLKQTEKFWPFKYDFDIFYYGKLLKIKPFKGRYYPYEGVVYIWKEDTYYYNKENPEKEYLNSEIEFTLGKNPKHDYFACATGNVIVKLCEETGKIESVSAVEILINNKLVYIDVKVF
jgi:hypothetical protein